MSGVGAPRPCTLWAPPGGGVVGLLRRHRLLLLLREHVAAEHALGVLRRDAVRGDDVDAAVEPLPPQPLERRLQVGGGSGRTPPGKLPKYHETGRKLCASNAR